MRTILLSFVLLLAACVNETPAPEANYAASVEALAPQRAIDLPVADHSVRLQDICGRLPMWSEVAGFSPPANFPPRYVELNQASTVMFRWLSDDAMFRILLGPGALGDPNLNAGNVGSEPWCSGTLIEHGRVLTASHCFDMLINERGWTTPYRSDARGEPDPIKPRQLAHLMEVVFDYQLDSEFEVLPETIYRVSSLVEYQERTLSRVDYAIVELTDRADAPLRNLSFASVGTSGLAPRERAVIIQHPDGLPKKIHFGAILTLNSRLMTYAVDTLGGSSGAGVRDLDGRIRAVHIEGGCNQRAGGSGSGNAGVPINAIRDVSTIL